MCHPRESRTATGEPERTDERAWWRALMESRVGEPTDLDEPTHLDDPDESESDREEDPVPADD